MGFMIKSASVCENLNEYSSVKLAVDAGERCIERSHMDKKDIDLLINIGIYRDRNILEPAMATLIQKELCLNNDPVDTFATHSTFSFDVANGAPSFINAIQVADAMMQNGQSQYAMIVSSDTHPSRTKHKDFPFSHFGAAMLIGTSDRKGNGNGYILKASRDGNYGLRAGAMLEKNGQNMLNITMDDDYIDRLKAFTIKTLRDALSHGELDITGVKALVASQPCRDFGKTVAEGIGMPGDMAIDTFDDYGDTQSSSLILGYSKGIEKGLITENDKVLFVGAGAGLAVGCCVI